MMKRTPKLFYFFTFLICTTTMAQLDTGVYFAQEGNVHHELKVGDGYLILSSYEKSPAKFIKTMGGFYKTAADTLMVALEFNSNFKEDSLREWSPLFQERDGGLVVQGNQELVFKPANKATQDLDGAWLFATRGPDKGQERRGDANPRKTLKFLQDGRFQWIAYNTETMEFFGTGGGSFSSEGGQYVEHIEYFSRDDSRVGASLEFNYELKNGDWHHKGNNSRGEPMYEIWAKR